MGTNLGACKASNRESGIVKTEYCLLMAHSSKLAANRQEQAVRVAQFSNLMQ